MNIKSATALLALRHGRAITLGDSRGTQVRVLKGALWITQDGDTADHFARRGESFRVDRDGPTVVQALQDSRFVLEAPHTGALERWWNPLARRVG